MNRHQFTEPEKPNQDEPPLISVQKEMPAEFDEPYPDPIVTIGTCY